MTHAGVEMIRIQFNSDGRCRDQLKLVHWAVERTVLHVMARQTHS